MRSKNTITVELNKIDAAIAAVLLAERAGTAALNALLSDKTAEIVCQGRQRSDARDHG